MAEIFFIFLFFQNNFFSGLRLYRRRGHGLTSSIPRRNRKGGLQVKEDNQLRKQLQRRTASAKWTEHDTWQVLNRVRKEKAAAGNRRGYVAVLAVAAALVILCVGVLGSTGTLGLNGRPDHLVNTTAPVEFPLAQAKITDDTPLYYIPEIGEFYHLSPTCRAVSIQHKPLQAHFTFAEVNNEAYRKLTPCSACGAPQRPPVDPEPAVSEVPVPTPDPAAGEPEPVIQSTDLPGEEPDATGMPDMETSGSPDAQILYTYTVEPDGTARITGITSKKIQTAEIPAEIDGYPVTTIGANTFKECVYLQSAAIPEGVVSMEGDVFNYCPRLTEVTLPDSLVEMQGNPFSDCDNLKAFHVSPDHPVYAFENHALIRKTDKALVRFADPDNKESYEIPYGIQSIDGQAFSNCKLQSVTIPETVASIGWCAFSDCKKLTEIVLPEGLATLGHQVFLGCSSLRSVNIPDSLVNIDIAPFGSCDNLASIEISPDHPVFEVRDCVLINKYQHSIVSASAALSGKYEVPDGIQAIGKGAFQGCEELTEVILPDSVTAIRKFAFSGCCNLMEITVPDSVSVIASDAFETNSISMSVRGYAGSYVQEFCEKNHIPFKVIYSAAETASADSLLTSELDKNFPAVSRELKPLGIVSENEFARAELVSGLVKGQEGWFVFTLQDRAGTWFDYLNHSDILPNAHLRDLDTIAALHHLTSDTAERKTQQVLHVKFSDAAPAPDSTLHLKLGIPNQTTSRKQFLSDSVLNQAKVTEGVDLPLKITQWKQSTIDAPDTPEKPKKILDYTQPLDIRLSGDFLSTDVYYVSGIGWIDNQFHIQLRHITSGKNAPTSSADLACWVGGKRKDCSVLSWRTPGSDSEDWLEFIWKCTPEDLSKIGVQATLTHAALREPAEWTFDVPVASLLAQSGD